MTDTKQTAIETDPARIQQIKNSIAEGRLILRAGVESGKSVKQLWAIRMQVERDMAKIESWSRIFKPANDFTVKDVTPF